MSAIFDLTVLTRPLSINEIDFRIQSINKGGYATFLVYKDARVDMNRLDEAVTPLGWQRKHEIIDGNLYCHIGIYNPEIKEWIWKSDVGTESNTEAQKGQASDSFKRAAFNWGIGRELYDYPVISVKLFESEFKVEGDRVKPTFNLKIKEWKWEVLFDKQKVIRVIAFDQTKKERFKWDITQEVDLGERVKLLKKELAKLATQEEIRLAYDSTPDREIPRIKELFRQRGNEIKELA